VFTSKLQPAEHQLLGNSVIGWGILGYISKLSYVENCFGSQAEINFLMLLSC